MDRYNRQASEDDPIWYTKDLKTPDENRSNGRQSQASSGLLAAFLESFQDPEIGQAPNVTIADFYKMVQALTDVMHEVQTEKDTPDNIEEQVLSFLSGLTDDIKVSFLFYILVVFP